jgi:hypothetical protein
VVATNATTDMATGSNSHSHPVKVGGKTYTTGSIGHQHTETPKPADAFTAAEVAALKALLVAGGGGGGTAPGTPNPPPDPPLPPVISNVAISAITTSGATITWNTDLATTGVVRHSLEPSLAGYSTTAATASGTSHNRTITGYAANVRVYFAVVATGAGGVSIDQIRSFQTQAVVIPPGPEPPGSTVSVNTFAELRAAVDNLSISTVIVEDGTYNIGYFLPPIARPSSNPLLVQADNIPASPEDPHGVIFTGQGMYFRNRRGSYTTWQGISFEGISVADTGIVVFGAYGEPGPDHVTFLDTRFVSNTPLNAHNSHHFYLSDGNSHDILIDRFYVQGVSHSAFSGFHAYHNPLGYNVSVKNGEVQNVYAGLLMYGNLTGFLAEDIVINNVKASVDMVGIQGTLRRVDATSTDGYGQIKSTGSGGSGPTVLDDCSGLPAVTP